MRHLAVGDIHGCYRALTTLAAFVPFEPVDLVITLGDYVNRGPNSRSVLDWLIDYKKSGRLVSLRGNHDIMMMQARESPDAFREFLRCGGDATLASYGVAEQAGQLVDVPDSHWQFLEETRSWYENDTHIFVHANVYADDPMDEQPDYMLFWEALDQSAPHCSGKTLVCGHTSQKTGLLKNLGHAVCIDTWAYGGGWLTCLDVETGQYWKANQHGDTRWCWLGASE